MELIKQIDETVSFNEKNIRVIGSYQEPWFVAKDICNILELKNITETMKMIPEKWRGSEKLNTFGGEQNMIIINEAGLYKLIMRSNKPVAQKFQEVVCEEILPSLRKKGEYKIQSILDKNKELEEENKKLAKKYVKKTKQVFDGKNVVYLMTSEEAEKVGEYVIGKATDLSVRKENYDQNKLHDFKVIYYLSCPNSKLMDIIESAVLMKLGNFRCKAGRDVFLLPNNLDIKIFTNIFDECFNFYKDVEYVVYPKRTLEKEDPDKLKERHEKYREENKDKIYESGKEYRENNKEILSEIKKEYYQNNADIIAEKNKKYYEENKEDIIEINMKYYEEHKDQILEDRKEHYENNKEQILEERAKYYKDNYKTKIAVQRSTKVTCECGMIVTQVYLKRHKNSERHKRLMEKLI